MRVPAAAINELLAATYPQQPISHERARRSRNLRGFCKYNEPVIFKFQVTGHAYRIERNAGIAWLPSEQMTNTLREIVRSIDPQLPLSHLQSMQDVVSAGQAPRRFNTVLITTFAGAAALLVLLGIYGVVAFSTMLRSHEMAIRLALGAPRSSVVRLILVSGAKLGLAVCAIGGVAAIFATRLLRSFVFQVDALDPPVLLLAVAMILLIALGASALPARRAAAVDPLEALRAE
jgi:ABC-type antimicrobial peptide transport system permease subunit